MLISSKIRSSWKTLLDHGDIEKIKESSKNGKCPCGISRVTISSALRTGRMSETTFEAIQKYFREKAEKKRLFIKENTIQVIEED